MESQQQHSRAFSFEFYPPKTEKGRINLGGTRERLESLKPRFFSVTFGAGGSTRDRTIETVLEIQRESSIDAAPH
ncbi:MAG: methylenetetrahydrofolate reductase [NAD(P)H], partial [Gammaproteobacteria bacterium]|nr:methylenetetrahydrofolate reductase [NAD(P)H] [Gammaproteobacteria bacterium]